MNQDKRVIWILDDDQEVQKLIQFVLEKEYQLSFFNLVEDLRNALSALNDPQMALVQEGFRRPDLLILDELLPDGRGREFCQNLRKEEHYKQLPILMLTAQKDLGDKLLAFNAGVDDYIQKPFDTLELKARVECHFRIHDIYAKGSSTHRGSLLHCGDLVLNQHNYTVLINRENNPEGIKIVLSPMQFKILHYLGLHRDQVYERNQLIEKVWGQNAAITDRTVDQHISKLKKKIHASDQTIKSIYGVGYMLTSKM